MVGLPKWCWEALWICMGSADPGRWESCGCPMRPPMGSQMPRGRWILASGGTGPPIFLGQGGPGGPAHDAAKSSLPNSRLPYSRPKWATRPVMNTFEACISSCLSLTGGGASKRSHTRGHPKVHTSSNHRLTQYRDASKGLTWRMPDRL